MLYSSSRPLRFAMIAMIGMASFSTASYAGSTMAQSEHPNFAQEWRSTKVEMKETYMLESRRISDAITSRLSSQLLRELTHNKQQSAALSEQNPMAASSDDSGSPVSVWTTFSWTRLSNDGLSAPFDTDLFQSTSGVDKRIGDFIVGATLSYSYADTTMIKDGLGIDVGSQTHYVDLSPYAAYIINKNFFISAFTGYNYSSILPRKDMGDGETDGYNSELAINGLHAIDNWSLRGKIGMRYQHFQNKTQPMMAGGDVHRDNLDNFIPLADADIGYTFNKNIRAYTGVLYEFNSRPSLGRVESIFYYNAGIDYWLSDSFTIGAKVQTDLNNENVDLTTVGLNARLTL